VHAVAQLVRHSRGLVTTLEKWVAATPPEALPGEVADVLWLVRGALTDLTTTLGTPRPVAAPVPAPSVTTDRPAASRPPDLHR